MEDAAIDHELLPMLRSLADRGLLLRMVDGAADQLAMSELAVLSTVHWSESGLRAPAGGASDEALEVGRRNLVPSPSGGEVQPSGPKFTMLMVRCPLGREVIFAIRAVPSGKGSACKVQLPSLRSMRKSRSVIKLIGKRSGTAACSVSLNTVSFMMPLSPAIPAGTSIAPTVEAPPPMPLHDGT